MDVGGWLRSLGLGQYEAAFRDNDIDGEILRELTAEDLIGLGIGSIGHRRKLLAAIAALRETPERAPTAPQPERAKTAPRSELADAAVGERRQLTIMFCDVVGSTELATRLDPEDLRDVIGAYQRCAADVLGRFGGFVAKYMGDGILAYFGYPEAHEDDAERAVRAGLAIIDTLGRLDLRQPLELRLGIATGLVVVGDLIGAGAAQERGVVGETPNLAARLQSLAEPNGIVIDDGTRRQIGTLFELRPLGPQTLKGFGAATHAWQAIAESAVASRFEALRSRATPLVGREEEIELLQRRWTQAKAGDGRVVLFSAEPGLGKSRLTEALAERIAAEPQWRLRYFCSPHHQDSAFHPIIGQLEHAAGFARDDGAAEKRGKLSQLLSSAKDDLPIFAELPSLPQEKSAALQLTPQRKKELTFEALLRRLESLARDRPVLMVFEDLHWMDATSLELLDRTIARVERMPVLLIATMRPEFQPPWVGQAHVTMLSLSRLGRREGAALVERLVGNAGVLPADVIEEIIERTDGVPLFLEEVTKVVLEAGSQLRDAAAAIPGARAAVPATLQASLMARLDRLGPTPRVRLPRPAPRSAAISPTICSSRSRRAAKWRCATRSTGSSPPVSCSSGERPPRRITSSSMRSCRMRPTAPCCAALDRRCTGGSRRPSRRRCRTGSSASPSSWPTICPKLGGMSARRRSGARPERKPCGAPPTARRSSISGAHWRPSRPSRKAKRVGARRLRSCRSSRCR